MESEENSQEVWLEIPGWEGFYEVSSLGRIRSIRRLSRVNSITPDRKRMMGGKVRKLQKIKGGYLRVPLTADGRRESMQVHRAVLLAFKGNPADGQVARHLNGNPSDNRAENLEWGTHLENMEDRQLHGNYENGERHVMARLSDKDALHIYISEELGIDLAEHYGVSPTVISSIRRGHTWRHVTGGKPAQNRQGQTSRKTDKMDFEKAEEARLMRCGGSTLKQIAAKFGISEGTASEVCSGKTWVKK